MELLGTQAELPGVVDATAAYEAWMAEFLPLWEDDLEFKHRQMAASPFLFLRSTFYRWVPRWLRLCPEEASSPPVPAVGDLHVQNFGTWRDLEGRLVWGINDFDEVAVMPYTMDLVRLATSARLALKAGGLQMTTTMACAAILDGYTEALKTGGRPLVLAENDRWLRRLATGRLRDPDHFWPRIARLPELEMPLRSHLRRALRRDLPPGFETFALRRRRAGLGSLGRERVCAFGIYEGGHIAREVKAIPPAAWSWATGSVPDPGVVDRLLTKAVRCPDPYLRRGADHVARRLAPDCSRLELADMPTRRDDMRLLRAMGWETANMHLADPQAVTSILSDLAARQGGWLEDDARRMARATLRDWKEWRSAYRGRPGAKSSELAGADASALSTEQN